MSDQINLLRIQAQQQITEIHGLQFELILRQAAVDILEQLDIEACKLAVLINDLHVSAGSD
ncbi:hypothetical protein D3C80_1932290 [compost metagenome]